jgi:hypothetical protein
MELNKTELYCKSATKEDLFDFFTKISKALIKQKKIRDNSVSRLFNTNIANKKQHDSLYSKQYNDNRIYNSYLEDLKIIVKYL